MTKIRKTDHLRIAIEKDVEYGNPGFDRVRLKHFALPEIDFDEIDMSVNFLGKKLNYPIIMEAITGGVKDAKTINEDLSKIAEEYKIGFGVGSQRLAIEDKELEDTYRIKADTLVIANIGAVQLNYGYGFKELKKAVDMINADAIALHLNPLQECFQPEGNRNFSNLKKKINEFSGELRNTGIKVIIKEVGNGISYEAAKDLYVDAIDVAGMGGTSWAAVEGYRNSKTANIDKLFYDWGISTVDSLIDVSRLNIPIIASGGVRNGLDAAKCIALGASCVGMALPILREYTKGKEHLIKFLDDFILELKIAMFLTGSENVKSLKDKIYRNTNI